LDKLKQRVISFAGGSILYIGLVDDGLPFVNGWMELICKNQEVGKIDLDL
jgi:hypothetical protein